MGAQRKLDIKNHLLQNARVLGHSDYDHKQLASDLVNSLGKSKGARKSLVEGTFLSYNTIERIATLTESETGRPYFPSADTLKRIFRFFNVEFTANQVAGKSRYANTPKEWL